MNLIKILALLGVGYYVGKNGLPQLPSTGGVQPAEGETILMDAFGNRI